MRASASVPSRILLGVSGGIAAYKACELTRRLRDAGAEVRVVLTANAERFVTATTFQALSGQPVRSSLWDAAAEAAMGHIELARWAERIVIAPATADLIARLAHGRADDLLTTLCLASERPPLLVPAMNHAMWAHPATQANVATLRSRGVELLGPAVGDQACGETGPGRMVEPADIVAALLRIPLDGVLAGRRVVVSAGPTHEDLDPVRFIGNRSSGRMGFAIAAAAQAAGAQVTLIAGPVSLPTPAGVTRIDVRSAHAMLAAMVAAATEADIVIAAAAVADYRAAATSVGKIKKSGAALSLALVENPDILAALAALPRRPFLVGFAAETEDLEAHARAKLVRKGIDLIAANRVGDGLGIETDDNALELYWADGHASLPRAPKPQLAQDLIAAIAARHAAARGAAA